ncbi:recombinase RecT [Burkholderia multivorans]|uniref:recombinase RecT n=1 Tax=Burkholderia multivorans TaxID=87883 RepID=UPI0009E0C951|nr:recombinase RecT [Burkholderia multivorans]MCO1435416.1 recombinase RecT [Burkholderia multivorans]UQN62098.1 recombinase RecT [Burkholderia multivorans]UQN67690.1 recombinase RecT [Burkholderia multivorans]UQO04962.1 recombinase RecT [Burkholderia multivorans]UQO05020.1 recombinase RecT [Burkholderia multivorans]
MATTTNLAQLKTTSKMVAREAGIGSVKQFFESQKGTLAAVLPRHVSPDRMLKIALGALRTTPKLMECTVESLMGAVVQCSQLGLEPNTPLGHAYLIPFEKKKKVGTQWVTDKVETQIVIGYKGLIDLARRSGKVVSIAAHAVYEHDHFDYAFGLNEKLEHKPAMSARGRVIAFYAVAKLVGGGHAFEVMSAEQVNEIRDASQNYKFARDKEKTVWGQHYEEMGRKTVLRRLFKYLPVSIELASAAALDDVGASGRSQALDTVLDGDYITPTDDESDDDGEINPPSGLTDQRQQQNDMTLPSYDDLLSQIQNAKDEEVLALVLDSARDLPQTEYVKLEQAYQDRREVLLNA